MEKKKYLMPCIDIIREVHSPFLADSNDEWTGDQLGKEVEMNKDFFDEDFLPSDFKDPWDNK